MSVDKYRHKWWGWGPEGVEYDMESRPALWPWIVQTAELGERPERLPPVELDRITLPLSRLTEVLSEDLRAAVGNGNVREDNEDRPYKTLNLCCSQTSCVTHCLFVS